MVFESKARRLVRRLEKKMRRGHRGDPVGTVAFYGPDNRVATKVVSGIATDGEIGQLGKWFSESGDVRDDEVIMQSVVDHLSRNGAVSIVMTSGIFGCPHEEGIDYPDGAVCSACPYWAEHDRESVFDT